MVFYIVFESSTRQEFESLSAKYYDKLTDMLKTQPGFIKETPFTATSARFGEVAIASFVDDEAAHHWRKDPYHLQVQSSSRAKIFKSYRIRAGPVVSTEELASSSLPPSTDRTVMLVEDSKDRAVPLDLDVLRSESDLAHSIIDIATYDNDEKVLYIVSWDSEQKALDFASSELLARYSSVLCIRVTRDYGSVAREEAPV